MEGLSEEFAVTNKFPLISYIFAPFSLIIDSPLSSSLNSSLLSISPSSFTFPWLVSPIVGVYAKESVVSVLPLYSADPVTLLPVFNKIVGTPLD